MPNMTSPGTGGLKLAEEIKELKQENEELKMKINGIEKMKAVATGSLKAFLKANIKNGNYMVFPFYNLSDNPFPTIKTGYAIATYSHTIGSQVELLGFYGEKIESALMAIS